MKTRFFTLLLTSLLLFSTAGFSGEADIAITLEHQPLDDLQFGQVIPFSISITNHGPDVAGADSFPDLSVSATTILFGDTGLLLTQDLSINQNCFFILSFGEPFPPNPLAFIYSFYYPQISPNESFTCYGLFQLAFDSSSRSVEWFLYSPLDSDPDETNNTATMVFGIKPPMVSSLTTYSMLFLMLLIFVLTKRQFMLKASNTSHKKH